MPPKSISTPTITVAIPLYRSYRFLDIISQNITSLPVSGVTILISDRHCDDNALDILQQRFSNDSRIRFLQATDRIDWVDHYNFLLREATTHYFMWMPHDDTFPPGYVTDLVQNLQENPDAWLSFGDIIRVDLASQSYQRMYMPSRFSDPLARHRPLHSVKLLCFWNMGIPVRGVFNRQRIVERQLFMKKINNSPDFADIYWVFGLSLQGRLLYNNKQYCLKRYYPTSTHAPWHIQNFFIYSQPSRRLLGAYIDDAHFPAFTKFRLKVTIELLTFVKRVYHVALNEFIRDRIRQYLTGHQKKLDQTSHSLQSIE